MKLRVAGVVLAFHFAWFLGQGLCQDNKQQPLHLNATGPLGAVALTADRIERTPSYPGVIQLRGHVEIRTKTVVQHSPVSLMIMIVSADEADYHEDTSEIEARGKVRVDYRDDPVKTTAVGNVRIKLETARSEPNSQAK